ncbi:uncharacterized protein LOC109277868 [Panthera pardus]|uniref:Uncharacterized protein LOC109277868 n=1 Tax=Panthera pardus TaxID=9691 RepID=A0A9W2VNH0_PANPR|nr:uncharacterized protein LOC109277868 [Panthera pardus]
MSLPPVRLRNPAGTARCTRVPGGTARLSGRRERAIVRGAQSRRWTGLPESPGRRRCSSAGAREVFLLAQSWRHRAAGAGREAAAGTRSAPGRLRARGATGNARTGAWSPSSVSALAAGLGSAHHKVLSALQRALALQWPLTWSRSPASARTRQPGLPFYSLQHVSTSLPPSSSLLAAFPSQRHRPLNSVGAKPRSAPRAGAGEGDCLRVGWAPRARQSGGGRRRRGAVTSTLCVWGCCGEKAEER